MTSPLGTRAAGFTLADGFPNSGAPTMIPSLFFARVLPEIVDPAELIVTTYVFYAVTLHKRQPRFVTLGELEADAGLARALGSLAAGDGVVGASLGERHSPLWRGLELAVARGSLIRAEVSSRDEMYVVNTPANRKALGRLAEQGVEVAEALPAADGETAPNIFALYEENIGSITPLIADDLREAEGRYPKEWVLAAFREAVELNKRSWRYIERILQRWETEGRDEEHRGSPEGEWLARRYREGKQRG